MRVAGTRAPVQLAKAGLTVLQASISVFTDSTDFANIVRSSFDISISRIRSTPFSSDHHRHADIHALDVVLAVEIGLRRGSTRFLSFRWLSAMAMAEAAGA